MRKFLLVLVLVAAFAPRAFSQPYVLYAEDGDGGRWTTDLVIKNGSNISRLDLTRCSSGPPFQINLGMGQVRWINAFAKDVPCAPKSGAIDIGFLLLSGDPEIAVATFARNRGVGDENTTAFLLPSVMPLGLDAEFPVGPIVSDATRDTGVILAHAAGDATGVIEVVLKNAFQDRISSYTVTVPPYGLVLFMVPRDDVPVGSITVTHRASVGGEYADIVGVVTVGRRAPDSGAQVVYRLGPPTSLPTEPCSVSPCF